MYPVSESYINKLKSTETKRRTIFGSVGEVAFNENDLLKGSFSYTEIAVQSSDIKLGGVFVGTLKLTFLKSFLNKVPRGTWKGKKITVSVGTKIGDKWEYVPLKPYYVDEANHSALGVDVVAYDAMTKFDVSVGMNQTSGSLYDFAVMACTSCGVELENTESEMSVLPNGDKVVSLYPQNDVETWRDFVSWIAVTLSGFATINRNGKLEFRVWKNEHNVEIGVNNRFTGGTWSDFETNYTSVKGKNADNTEWYTSTDPDNGLTLDIGSNPLMQYGTDGIKSSMRNAILESIQYIKYTPFKSSSLIDPALDLGDVILYSGGLANNALCCVMRIDFSFQKGATVQGYGKNPLISGVRDKNDKALTQAMSKVSENEMVIHTYINSQVFNVNSVKKKITSVKFTTINKTTVTMHHEIKLDVGINSGSSKASVTAWYYLNDDLIAYQPVDNYSESGFHILPLMYFVTKDDIMGGTAYKWEVYLSIEGGSATIGRGDVHAYLQGQGLVAIGTFDGLIELFDEYEPVSGVASVTTLTDSKTLTTQTPISAGELSDTYSRVIINGTVNFAESKNLTFHADLFDRVLEGEETQRLTEDGDLRMTEEYNNGGA